MKKLLTMREAAASVGNGVHLATIHRWSTAGVRNIKLRTTLVGGRRFVERAELDKFLAAINGDRVETDDPQDADEAAELERELART